MKTARPSSRTRLGLGVAALLGLLSAGGCTRTPDPCEGYPLACIGVTVDSGPPQAHQLLVRVLEGYGSTTPITPRRVPDKPLTYPLRFAVRFEEFDQLHRGKVTVELTAIDRSSETLGQAQREVEIWAADKVAISMTIGPPFDMAEAPRPDLSMPADMTALDLTSGPDMP
jgi:hypothetical protein